MLNNTIRRSSAIGHTAHAAHTAKDAPAAGGVRRLSDHVTFTSIDRSQSRMASGKLHPNPACKLRVPLLKSPSHLGHFSSRVNRMYNEDRYSAHVLDIGGRTVFNFNIFDGHGGDQCSTFLQHNLGRYVEQASPLVESESDRDALFKKYSKDIGGYWKRWFKHRENNVDKMKNALPQISSVSSLSLAPDDLMLRLPMAFLDTDFHFFNQEDNKSGSTCTSAYLEAVYSEESKEFRPVYENYFFNRKTISKLTVASVGDTRAILVDRQGAAHALTTPHHPSNPIEAARLRRYSANNFMMDSFGEERFISLANTRAFGDLNFKDMGVTAEPEVSQYLIGDADTMHKKLSKREIEESSFAGLGGDECFLVLCTDGITNELTDQEVADIVMEHFNRRGHLKATPQSCAEEVVNFVEFIGGDDNASCLVVRLNGWGKWPMIDRTGHLRQERLNDFHPRDRG